MKIFLRILLSLILVLALVTALAYFDVVHIPAIKSLVEKWNLPWTAGHFRETGVSGSNDYKTEVSTYDSSRRYSYRRPILVCIPA